MSEIQKLK